MLTIRRSVGYCLPAALLIGVVLLAGCSARPVLHSFPMQMAPAVRPDAAVTYTLREREPASGEWQLRGGQGDLVGEFRWKPAFRSVEEGGAPDRSEDFRRDDLFQDGINKADYIFRLGATSGNLKRSTLTGTAPPRVTVFSAATGQRVGELELRSGFDVRFEGDWNGRQVLWRMELVPELEVERKTNEGKVLDRYPAAQRIHWAGGSTAGLIVYGGREIDGEPAKFQEPIFDIQAGRPLTRRELGDAMTLLFGIRAVQEAAVLVNSATNDDE